MEEITIRVWKDNHKELVSKNAMEFTNEERMTSKNVKYIPASELKELGDRVELAEKCMREAWNMTNLVRNGDTITSGLKEYREKYPTTLRNVK